MKIRGFVFFLCLQFAFASYGLAEDVRVTGSFDKQAVSVNEEIHLTIRVLGAKGNVQAPRLPGYDGFDTFYTGRASHMTVINGQSSSSVEFSYVLVPKKTGQFVLEPIQLTVNGQNFATSPATITVSGSTGARTRRPQTPSGKSATGPASFSQSQPSYQAPPAPVANTDDNIFVQAWVDKKTVYPNEQILLTYSLFTRYDTRYEGFEEEPQVSGFWIEEFPAEREVRRETVRLQGKRYVKADIKQMALFPTTPAEYTINPGSLKVSIRHEPQSTSIFDEFFNDSFFTGGSFFSRRENRLIKPPPIALTVKPFPERGKPEGFQGDVGNFRMNATIDHPAVKQNEPVTMTILIEGEGNIETLNKPVIPEMPNFKIYDSDTSSQLYKTGRVIGGQKTFELIFIPTSAGTLRVPAFGFHFFNPNAVSYKTLKTPEFVLQVEASEETVALPQSVTQQDVFKKDVQIEGKDIRYIQEHAPESGAALRGDFILKALVAGNGLLTLLIFGGLWNARRETLFEKDNALKRRRLAKSRAERRIKDLRKLTSGTYYEEVEKILTQYLSDKFDFSAYGVTRRDLEQHLESKLGSEDSLFLEIRNLYQSCDEARFGKSEIPKAEKKQALKILRDAMTRVEKIK